jgi:threonine/homoserine/homoserine lactone efflux protein
MVALGGIAAVIMLLGLLTAISWFGLYFSVLAVQAIFFLIAVAGGLVMGWAGWQEFQAEGGKFQIGSQSSGGGTPPAGPPPPPSA